MRMLLLFTALLLVVAGCNNDGRTAATPENTTVTHDRATTDRNNTAINKRDAEGDTSTPFDQSNEQSDIDLVAEIRSQVLEIEDLSVNGRNVKIITNGGKAVLRGPVATQAERDAIAKIATDLAGDGNVTDQLEVDAK
ncbi:MAG: BON domain-containing protein [Planctomycetota bacterium]